MKERNESLPRVSSLIKFIYEEELDQIPEYILKAAADRGTEKHTIIEKNYGKSTDNIISAMFRDGLFQIFSKEDLQKPPTFEEQLNGSRYTGKPDFVLNDTLIDYKFSNDLRPVTALQMVFYALLIHELKGTEIKRLYAFHFPKDHGLFMYKVPTRAIPALINFAKFIIDNHQPIKEGELERYEALSMWATILQDFDVFEPVGSVLPPMTITNDDDLMSAVITYFHIKPIIEKEKALGREIKRYMEETGQSKIEDHNGCGIRLGTRTVKLYDTDKKAAAKAIYDKALAECQTGTLQSVTLTRFSPRKSKPKLIT